MAYSRQEADSVSKSSSPSFSGKSEIIAINKHATVSSLYLFMSFSEVRICLGMYEDFPSYEWF